ncbi:MAG: hypothetical protein KAR79_05250 [Simkaniaceae bacterium]|nr:hypothetical protein [Simkaniaceae bacterium]
MNEFFFSGSVSTKVDDKNRFVLPQAMRYGLIENGSLEFTIALGLGGALAIYKRSDINKIVKKFQKKQHDARYQKFFTLFFSTLHHTTCDKLGRVVIPAILKKAAGIEGEIVVAGVLNKIEIWPKAKYEEDLDLFLNDTDSDSVLAKMTKEAFALLDEEEEVKEEKLAVLNTQDKVVYEGL